MANSTLSELHQSVSSFITALEKKMPKGVNDQIIRDQLSWVKKNLAVLNSRTNPKDVFEFWYKIANGLNIIKNNILKKHDEIPSFNQVQAKQYEEYTNEMRHALPMAGMEAIPDIQRYTLSQEQYEKSIKEFFPYYEELQSFITSKEFHNLFEKIKDINLTLQEQLPDLYLELKLHDHLKEKQLDRKEVEDLLRRNISDIINGDHLPQEKVFQIRQVIINTYYFVQKSAGGSSFFGFHRGSKLGTALFDFINAQDLLGNNEKVPRVVRPNDEPPILEKPQYKTGMKKISGGSQE